MSAASDAYEALLFAMDEHRPECRGLDLFTADSISPADAEVMKRICDDCPLLDACREYAREARPKAGFWAGRRYPTKGTSK